MNSQPQKIVFFDLETSGLSPWKNEIMQVAAAAVDAASLDVIETYEQKVQFDMDKANPEALQINHYDEEQWVEEAISQSGMVQDFGNFLRRHSTVELISRKGNPYSVAQLAGHNILRFDIPFLQATFKRHGAFLPARLIGLDTLQLVAWNYHLHPSAPKNLKLGEVLQFLGGEFEGEAHDALSDVLANIELVRRLREEAP